MKCCGASEGECPPSLLQGLVRYLLLGVPTEERGVQPSEDLDRTLEKSPISSSLSTTFGRQ